MTHRPAWPRAAAAALLPLAMLAGLVAWPQAMARQDAGLESKQRMRDVEFGVSTRHPGLQRRVEMYQWRREGDGFVTDWVSRAVDSSGFPATMSNPQQMPMPARYWIADDLRLDGHPLHDEVLQALGEWRRFRPSFNALPGNMGATFQPEGDGLGTAEDPQYPKVGDLRISWHELRLPPLQGKLLLHDGQWRLPGSELPAEVAANDDIAPMQVQERAVPEQPPAVVTERPDPRSAWPWWLLGSMLLAALALGARMLRRRRRR